MSTIPKARNSSVAGLKVFPDNWDSYPEVSKSVITDCTFTNLTSSSNINRSQISQSTLQPSVTSPSDAQNGRGIKIERSVVKESHLYSARVNRCSLTQTVIRDTAIDRCKLANCSVAAPNNLERTKARSTDFVSSRRVERTQVNESVVLGNSTIERCVINRSVIGDNTTCERTELDDVIVARSRIERSTISDCDITDCIIERTEFRGMVLKYGIWKNGNLIGRTSNEHEVVAKAREKKMPIARNLPKPSPSPAPAPAPTPLAEVQGPGQKAVEAEHERAGVESDNEEDLLPDELDASSDDEAIGTPPKENAKHDQMHTSGNYVTTSRPVTSIANIDEPPPPYEK